MFQCVTHGWSSAEKSCPECKLERLQRDLDDAIRRDNGGPRCSICGVREAKYGRYCGSCMGDMDL